MVGCCESTVCRLSDSTKCTVCFFSGKIIGEYILGVPTLQSADLDRVLFPRPVRGQKRLARSPSKRGFSSMRVD